MKCQQLLLVLWCSSVLEVISCLQVDGLSCVSDYRHNINCVLNITGDPEEQSNTTMMFKRINMGLDNPEVSCPLTVMNHSFSCDCKIDEDGFSPYYRYDIYLCDETDCHLIRKEFQPSQNIQLRPPPQLVLQHLAETVNITCNSRYQDDKYLNDRLKYELLLQKPGSSENKALHLDSPKTTLSIDATAGLQSDTKYCIKARYMVSDANYTGPWSEWGKETCWKHKAVNGLSCVSDYRHNINCVLNIPGDPEEQSNTTMMFKRINMGLDDHEVSCPLTVMNHSFSCDCKIDEDGFSSYYLYDIYLCDETDCQLIRKEFQPSQNIQLRPPPQLVLQHSTETVNITCNSRYQDDKYLNDQLIYELLLQKPGSGENKTLHLESPETTLSIDATAGLQSDTKYCIKARYMVREDIYRGTWSEWGRETCWKHKAENFSGQENILVLLAKSLGPVCMFVGVLLFLFYSPAVRMKIKTLSYTPSPAPFFEPLFQDNKGRLQEWLSPQGTYVLTYKPEEILTTDAIVPKPVTKDPEDHVFPDPSVSQLTFVPVQSSYVGLPEMQKAPPPIAMVCPRDTSYTQLPCPTWGFSIVKAEIASSPPDNFFEVSQPDSGCSFEDESQSPECSLPTSPAEDISPPPLACSDYCILNKTGGGGVVPVLVSKGCSVKVSSDSLQVDES